MPPYDSKLDTDYYTQFSSGIFCDQYQRLKYEKASEIDHRGERLFCSGVNELKPINVLINPIIGQDGKDINPEPFKDYISYLNPITVLSTMGASLATWYQGIKNEKRSFHSYGINISEISLGQETDIDVHYQNYKKWQAANPQAKLILWGVSRGGATTMNAFAKYQYPEVRLVVIEACFYSFQDLIQNSVFSSLSGLINQGLGFFTKYDPQGPSPAKSIETFPENIPVVFVSSKIDKIVPYESTKRLAEALACKGKNDVYLLELEHSSHPNYMFDDENDRNRYERFIHAIYEKYHIPHSFALAEKGRVLIDECLIAKPTHGYAI